MKYIVRREVDIALPHLVVALRTGNGGPTRCGLATASLYEKAEAERVAEWMRRIEPDSEWCVNEAEGLNEISHARLHVRMLHEQLERAKA